MKSTAPFPSPVLVAALGGLLAAALGTGCGGGGSSSGPSLVGPPAGLRVEAPATGGGSGDALAAALLVSTGSAVLRPGQTPLASADGELRSALAFQADSHVIAAALASGTGPRIEGSAHIRRQAAAHGAPVDQNGNGTNLDEVLAAELELIAFTAGTPTLPAFEPILFPWRDGTAQLLAPPGMHGSETLPAYRTLVPGVKVVETEQIGHAMMARLLLASRLLKTGRGQFVGATAEDGVRGLLLMQQVLAMEETLMSNLFHDGAAMGRISNPTEYDPRFNPPRWLPQAFSVLDDPELPGAPLAYVPHDRSSSLSGLAAVLNAASQLAWAASDENPHRPLRNVLRGQPFGGPPPLPVFSEGVTPSPLPSPAPATPGAGATVTWEENIKGLLAQDCLVCHGGQYLFNEFSVIAYEGVLKGGVHNPTHPAVVKGDPESSLLYQVLIGPVPSAFVSAMPLAGGPLEPEEVQLVYDWIKGGAPRGGPPGPPRFGQDLAQVLVRNLGELHQDAATGALHDRHEGDVPSGFAVASSTGIALSALAAYATAVPSDPQGVDVMQRAADYALQHLTDPNGHAHDAVEIATGTRQGGQADLLGHARLTAGLLAAGRVLGRSDLLERGRALAAVLLDEYLAAATGLFRTELGRVGRRYTPVVLAAVVDALREIAADGAVAGGGSAHDRFFERLLPHLVFAEWEGRGEVLGDGRPDTDGNGVREPGEAGGATGRAPLFVGAILEGPSPLQEPRSGPVTWSAHIQPLFRAKCATCHLDGSERGDYAMDTPTIMLEPGESKGSGWPLIVPGNPGASLLYRKLIDRNPPVGVQMPEALPPVSQETKELVRRWIAEGATRR